MSTTKPRRQERIARELLAQNRPLFLGVDGDGAAHYWDSYAFAVAVVETDDGRAEVVELADADMETLREWCEYTARERGWSVGPHIASSLAEQLESSL